ncbi:MAG TPA: hypothetical protein VE954_36695 [Oligoflexus sp.]|uniref:hypothetical protein n=1 Tax=Oligoflexus sp. TaxID=1971216 RepID=UPI002D457DE5|nr:hypothetical protein [Oligoflexus sp.]HYX38676.1 hypothetical protein [Oligoflexus sp.]
MNKVHIMWAVALLLPISCKDKPLPEWTVKITKAGKYCFDKDNTYVFGTGTLECFEYKSRNKGPALTQHYTRCYLDVSDKPIVLKSLLGKLETCEVDFEGKTYVFSGYTGEVAVMTQGDTRIDLTCKNTSDLSEYDDLDDCQDYMKSRYK